MSGKAVFTTLETTSGATIHRIPLEAFPNFWAYVYLLQKDAYCILIDTGSGTDTSHENLQFGLQQAGIVHIRFSNQEERPLSQLLRFRLKPGYFFKERYRG